MSKKLTRRDFIKIAAGATAATGLAPVARRIVIEPFVQPPEETLPGQATWYASTCRQCPAGCGIVVRTINGRAKKIEGNPLHPLNQGKLCARGQAGLQVLYNPDRLRNAVRQSGGRGSREYEPLYWSEALDLLAEKVSSLGHPDRMAFLGGLMPDHLYQLTNSLLTALGTAPPIIYDLQCTLEGRRPATQLSQTFFGTADLPVYDIAMSDVVFSFGANLFETWMSPVAQSVALGSMRQGKLSGRGLIVQFEPRLSATGASADEWIPVRPGAEGYVALAIGRIIVEERLGHVGSHRDNAVLYQNVDVREMSAASEVSVDTLRRLAQAFADADRAVAIPGGYLSGQHNGFASMLAVQALNRIVAQIGRQGGVFLSTPAPTVALRSKPEVNTLSDVRNLIKRMNAGEVDLLLIHGTNPLYELPAALGFAEAIKHVPYVVSFSPFVDETAVWADLILSDHTYLESWGYQVPSPGTDRPVISSQQPVVNPLYDTRSTAQVLIELAARLGGRAVEAIPWADEESYLQELVTELYGSSLGAFDARTPPGFWTLWRQYGGWWSEKEIRQEPETTDIVQKPLPMVDPQFDGDPEEYPFHLYPYSSVALTDGRGANQPWLQETPDPMTTVQWGIWVELNPQTAEELGVEDDDIVLVESPYGTLEVSVFVYPGIRPDVVAIPIGQGHQDYGRFAQAVTGSNPLALLAPITDPDTESLAWGATRVRLSPTGRKKKLARLESIDGQGRESIG
ncbi:MAG: molybdopterin-dependent oxidoreductase [Anaerolineales bacterium]|nr:MAG: molybdopterin-dependent oxidoreductase [Anaerolineales bacterium]